MNNDTKEYQSYFYPTQDIANNDIFEKINNYKIDINNEYEDEDVNCLFYNGEPFATLGNFSIITGKAKSKKTFLASLIAAAACDNKTGNNGITGSFPQGKDRIIIFDTEQSRSHVREIGKRIRALLNDPTLYSKIDLYALREETPYLRKELISAIIQSTSQIGLVIIDGIRDLITSVNDEGEASILSNGLMRISSIHNIHVIGIIHKNKTNNDIRGHLGTEVTNKAETVLHVSTFKNSAVSKAYAEYSRKKKIQPFSFTVNERGLPEIVEDFSPPHETEDVFDMKNPKKLPIEVHGKILQNILSLTDSNKYNYQELCRHIQNAAEKAQDRIGRNKAIEFYDYYFQQGYVKGHGKKRTKERYYTIHLPEIPEE